MPRVVGLATRRGKGVGRKKYWLLGAWLKRSTRITPDSLIHHDSEQIFPCLIPAAKRFLRSAPKRGRVRWGARVHAQIEEIGRREASNGKPFWEIRLRDAGDSMTLKAWSDSPNFFSV